MRVVTRLKKLIATLTWMTPLAGSLPAAALLLLQRKSNPEQLLKVTYAGRPFLFRGPDSNALVEVFHEGEYDFLKSIVSGSHAPKIIDVGAHIGTFGAWILNRNPSARLLSVEADPQTFSVLQKNSTALAESWRILHRAGASQDGQSIRFSTDGPSMSHRVSPAGNVEVETVSLKSLLDEISADGDVDLVKVDIEGAEEDFLCTMPDCLSRIRCLVIELHPGLCDTERVARMLGEKFRTVKSVGGRQSQKPLLCCVR